MSDADEFLKKYLENIRNQYNSSGFPPKYASGTMRTVTVSCRDGVELTADIYTPVMKGPYPTIVVRCPYPQQVDLWRLHGEELTKRGYAPIHPAEHGSRISMNAMTVLICLPGWKRRIGSRPLACGVLHTYP